MDLHRHRAAIVAAGSWLIGIVWALAIGDLLRAIEVLALGVALYPAYRLVSGRDGDPFAPIHLFVLYILLTINLRAVFIRSGGSGILMPLYDHQGRALPQLLGQTLLATTLFLVCLYTGYYSKLPARLCAILPRIADRRPTRFEIFTALAISAAIAVPVAGLLFAKIGASVAVGKFTAETRIGGIFWLGYLLRVAVLGSIIPFAASLLKAKRAPQVAWAVFALAAAAAVFVLWPKKIVLANQILALMVCTHYLRGRIRMRTLVIAGLVGLAMLPLLSAFRYWGFHGLSPTKLVELAGIVVDNPQYVVKDLFRRSFGADSIILILDYLRHDPHYELGGTFAEGTRWFVPRAIWPDKPPSYAILFGQQFLARAGYFGTNVSGTPTIVGELILNFGIVGLTVGGWVTGVCLKLPHTFLIERQRAFGAVVLYSTYLAGSVMFVEGPLEPQLMDVFISITLVAMLLASMELFHRGSGVWLAGRRGARADARRP